MGRQYGNGRWCLILDHASNQQRILGNIRTTKDTEYGGHCDLYVLELILTSIKKVTVNNN